jgi:two-component system sensor kinase FixL
MYVFMTAFRPPHSRPEGFGPGSALGRVIGGFSLLCVTVALLTCGLVLDGHYGINDFLPELAPHPYRMQPLAAGGGMMLGLVMLGAMRGGWRRVTLPLLAVPVVILLAALTQTLARLPADVEGVTLHREIAGSLHLFDDPVGTVTLVTLLLLAEATFLALRRERRSSQHAMLLAGLTLAIAVASGTLIRLDLARWEGLSPHTLMLAPSAVVVAALSLALLAWQYRTALTDLPWKWKIEGWTLRGLLVLCILAPIACALLLLWTMHAAATTAELVEGVHVGAQIMVSAAVLCWTWSRIRGETSARRELLDALDSAPIALVGMRGEILHWSKGCERLYGWAAREARGRIKHRMLGADVSGRWDAMVDRLREGLPCEEEIREQRRDGVPLFILEQARLVQRSTDREPMIVLSMTDITARTRAEDALRAREAKISSILRTVPDAMISMDAQARIRAFSATAERLLGYRAEQAIGRPALLLIPPRYRGDPDLRRTLLERGEAGRTQPFAVLHRDGTEIPVELAVSEARLGEERIFIAFLRDMTERLAGQARLAELREELLHVSRVNAMGEMAAGLAHELNQPLAAAANFLGAADMLLLDGQADGQRVREMVRLAGKEALRAGEIIRRMRDFSSRGAIETRVERLSDVLGDAVDLVLTESERQRAGLRVEIDRAATLIRVDRVQVQQVIVNLLRNALEAVAGRPGVPPAILLRASPAPNGMVQIAISDNGPGFAPDVLQRRHQPFLSTKPGGMGIGLSICRRIVESHGGTLGIEGRTGGGAVLRFTVPGVSAGMDAIAA